MYENVDIRRSQVNADPINDFLGIHKPGVGMYQKWLEKYLAEPLRLKVFFVCIAVLLIATFSVYVTRYIKTK